MIIPSAVAAEDRWVLVKPVTLAFTEVGASRDDVADFEDPSRIKHCSPW